MNTNLVACIVFGAMILMLQIGFFFSAHDYAKDKYKGVRSTSMSDLPSGEYIENYSDNEITFSQNGKVWKTYKKVSP